VGGNCDSGGIIGRSSRPFAIQSSISFLALGRKLISGMLEEELEGADSDSFGGAKSHSTLCLMQLRLSSRTQS
jgi:hypothetical protein